MALDALLELLEREAREQARVVEAEGRARAAAIEAQAAAEAERRRGLVLDRVEADGREVERRLLATAARRQQEAWLRARARVLDQVFAKARQTLASLPIARYRARVPDLVLRTAPYLGASSAVLVVAEDAAEAVAAAAGTDLRVVAEAGAAAGLVGRSGDGRVTVDNSLPTRLAAEQSDLAILLANRLEGA